MRRFYPSLIGLAALALIGWSQSARADDELPPPRVVAQKADGRELLPLPKEVKAAGEELAQAKDESKEEPKGKEDAKEPAKEEAKADPLDEVKTAISDLKTGVQTAKTSGDSAWLLTSSAFVMLMLPGLALFYGGMVRRKNVLATMMQSFAALAVVGLFWVFIGYSLAFGPSLITIDGGGIIGFSSDLVFLKGIHADSMLPGYNITVYSHVMFQGMFAIITPALISGAVAERIRFWPFVIFMLLWVTLVYCPLAHMVWAWDWFTEVPADWSKGALGTSAIGLLGKNMVLDFAGGTVVHIAAGMAGLAGALVLRKRIGYPEHAMHPNSMVLTLIGAGLLWFGWFGFNGGSATNSSGLSTSAFAATQVAAAAAGLSWIVVEWLVKGKPTALGLASGIVAGLVAVTPASGFVYIWGAVVIGLLAGVVCYFAVSLKSMLGYDDSLDAFGVHAVGGFLGAVLTGLFCSVLVNSAGANGPFAMSWQKARLEALPKLIEASKLEVGKYEEDLKKAQDKAADLEAKGGSKDAVKAAGEDATVAQKKVDFYSANSKSLGDEEAKLKPIVEGDKEKGPLSQFFIQLKAALLSAIFAFVLSAMLFIGVQALTGGKFTTDAESETVGLDQTEHGEIGFDYGMGLDAVLTGAGTAPRAAKAPPGSSEKRFAIVIEGTENGTLIKAWTELCKPKDDGSPIDPDFKAVYPYVTTVQGNRFRLRGGDPAKLSAHLQKLFSKVLGGKQLKVRIEE